MNDATKYRRSRLNPHNRCYLSPTNEQRGAAQEAKPVWKPIAALPNNPRNFNTPIYGLDTFDKLFTERQLVALTTFSDLVMKAREKIEFEAQISGFKDDKINLIDGGSGATAYAEAIATYLAFAVSKAADRNTSLCSWENKMDRMRNTFGRQAIPMVWDYAETNPIAGAGGDIAGTAFSIYEVLGSLPGGLQADVKQQDATKFTANSPLISTDPPYYDNIGYVYS